MTLTQPPPLSTHVEAYRLILPANKYLCPSIDHIFHSSDRFEAAMIAKYAVDSERNLSDMTMYNTAGAAPQSSKLRRFVASKKAH